MEEQKIANNQGKFSELMEAPQGEELSDTQMDQVSGGFNPQPDPPRQ
jgi:bacteriocin-like protein